jgi:uncharacterized metal-binding protein YceD (DUF177 family)
MFTIDTREIPTDETLLIEGDLPGDPFGLVNDSIAVDADPLHYRAEASILGEELLLRGEFQLPLRLACVRCLEPFPLTVKLADHSILVPLENTAVIDLTDALREDILLALPSFPRCDEATPDGAKPARSCPAGSFGEDTSFEPLDPDEGKNPEQDDWGALDKLKIDRP